ncbi:unnamed protein product [Amoebophrya sp. A25]|nr:unnamed protein product [Amoebophrya sp. A25]|eukprot:GSA25T00008746001.1
MLLGRRSRWEVRGRFLLSKKAFSFLMYNLLVVYNYKYNFILLFFSCTLLLSLLNKSRVDDVLYFHLQQDRSHTSDRVVNRCPRSKPRSRSYSHAGRLSGRAA